MNKHRIVDYYFYLLLCNDAHVGAISTCSAHNVETVVFSLVPHEMGQSFSKKKKKKLRSLVFIKIFLVGLIVGCVKLRHHHKSQSKKVDFSFCDVSIKVALLFVFLQRTQLVKEDKKNKKIISY